MSTRLATFLALLLCSTVGVTACTRETIPPVPTAEQELQIRYRSIHAALEKDGTQIDYDTLVEVYQKMVSSPEPIPHSEELLHLLIDQRNPDPRIDQMVLILAAQVMGKSQFPIPDDQALFERILNQDAERISHWVLMYVGDAIGNYRVDLPGGDALVDRIEQWQAHIDSTDIADKEYFGAHFLPPPKSPTIMNHLAGIQDQRTRQRERNVYYMMIMNNLSEDAIVAAFKYITTHGIPGSGKIPQDPLTAIWENWQRLPDEAKTPRP